MDENRSLCVPNFSPRVVVTKLDISQRDLEQFLCKNPPPSAPLGIAGPIKLELPITPRQTEALGEASCSLPLCTASPQPTDLNGLSQEPPTSPSQSALNPVTASPSNSPVSTESCSKKKMKVCRSMKSECTDEDRLSVTEGSKKSLSSGRTLKDLTSFLPAIDLSDCLVDPSSFVGPPVSIVIEPPVSNNSTSSLFNGPPASLSSTSTSTSESLLLGPLTTSSFLGSMPPVSNLDGLTDWLSFEECVQTATRNEAVEPMENGRQGDVVDYSRNDARIPETREDEACTHSPPSVVRPAQNNGCQKRPTLQEDKSVKKSPTKVQLDKDGKKKRGRPRKNTMASEKLAGLAASVANADPLRKEQNGSGKIHNSLIVSVSVKKEPLNIDQLVQPHPSIAQSAPKRKKKMRDKSTKATAARIAEVFEKPAPTSSTNQTHVEDSGYCTYISGSDSGSRSSQIPVSHSPPVNTVSGPVPQSMVMFDENSQNNVLIKDPILLSSGIQESILDQNEDITVNVLESGQNCRSGSNTFSHAVTLTPLVSEEIVLATADSDTVVPSDRDLVFQLDKLLREEATQMFSEDMVIGDTQEVATYEDEEDILNSDTVAGCLKELQQSGRIGGTSSGEPTSQSDPSLATTAGKGIIPDSLRGKNRKLSSRTDALPAATMIEGIKKGRILSMINSRTKSGRVSKPSARMRSFITRCVDDSASPGGRRGSPRVEESAQELASGENAGEAAAEAEQSDATARPLSPANPVHPVTPVQTTPLRVKLKDLRLSLPRSPMCQKLANFSFTLPELSTSPLPGISTRNLRLSEQTQVENDGPSHYERIVTIEATPPPREVRFRDSIELPMEDKIADIAKISDKKGPEHSSSNTLTMSLDVILEEMDMAKKLEQVERAKPADVRVVTMQSHDQTNERIVRFTSPDFDGSLTDKDIGDLLCPLSVDSSLEQVLQGDGLFGGECGGDSETVLPEKHSVMLSKSSALLSPLSPVDREVRFREEGVVTCISDAEGRTPGGRSSPVIPEASTASPKSPADKFSFKLPDTPSEEQQTEDGEAAGDEETDKGAWSVAERTVTFAEPLEEDFIDLHANDADLFDSEVKDTPLSKLFHRSFSSAKSAKLPRDCAPAKTMPTSQLKTQRLMTKHVMPHGCPAEPNKGLMPYKKQQVSQWVAEQQRWAATNPSFTPSHKRDRPVLALRGLNRNGNSSNELSLGISSQAQHSDPPPITPLSQGSWVGAGSTLEGHCKNYLRGKCDFINCRFKHSIVTTVPIHVMEAALFQGPPIDLPMEVLCRYSDDIQSCVQLQANQTQFYELMYGILNKNFSAVASSFFYFSFTVRFNKLLLVRVLELCSQQSSPNLEHARPLATAEKVYSDLCLRGGMDREAYYYYIKTLSNFAVSVKMMSTYQAMRSQGEPPTYDIMLMMLRLEKLLDHRILDLLADLKICSPPLSDIEEARCTNRLLDISDSAFLLKHTNQLVTWLDRTSPTVLNNLTMATFNKLVTVFTQEKKWTSLMSLLYGCSKYLLSLKSGQLCESLNFVVMSLGTSERVVDVLGMLGEEQLAGISTEVWNRVIAHCAQQARVEKARRFYRVASSHKKQVSVDTSSALMTLHLSQGDHSDAVAVLKKSLELDSSSLPPLPLLIHLCEVMDSPQDVQLVVCSMLLTSSTPPPAILQSLLNAHLKRKAHQTLAEVVKLSLDCNIVLDKLFYQKVLVELRQWGRDQDAISSVYKALRKVENLDVSEGSVRSAESTVLDSSPEVLPDIPPDPPKKSTYSLSSPLPVKLVRAGSASVRGGAKEAVKSEKTTSLENVLVQSPEDQSNLIDLIEVNGSQGQFGAVASILVTLPSANSRYDNQAVHAVWRAVVKSTLRAANAFSSLLARLAQSRSHGVSSSPQSSLFSSDRWLVSQVGIALLKSCEVTEDWQSGFVVLHHLHRFGIHYVKLSQPSSCLPPCMPHPPTPCDVALTAINVCMHIDQISGALEVMQGCNWIQPTNIVELNLRTKLLTKMVEKFLQLKQSENAWKCLQAVESGTVMKKYLHVVMNLHNKLLQTVLSSKDVALAQSVYCSMRDKNLQCLPTYFSSLLESLCSEGRETVARDLCLAAIKDDCYCSLSKDNQFQVTLPMGLVRIELYLLLEDHLRKIVEGATEKKLQPLVIQFGSGARSSLEQVFSVDFDPSLDAQFSSRGNSVTISSSSLRDWTRRHSLLRLEEKCTPSSVTSQGIEPLTSSPLPLSIRPISLPANPPDTNVQSCDLVEEMPLSHDQPVTSSEIVKSPSPTVTADQRPSEGEAVHEKSTLKRSVRLRLKRPIVIVNSSTNDSPAPKRAKVEKKQLKEVICRMFLDQLKPYYQSEKFKTPKDYTHLLKILSLNYFKTCKSSRVPPSKDAMNTAIATIVSRLMSRIAVYSMDMDDELGLTSSDSGSKAFLD